MTTIQKTWEVYCDESGTFRTVDTHVICPLIVQDNAINNETMNGIWKKSFPEGLWETFHATELKLSTIQKVFDRMLSNLFCLKNISARFIFHQNTRDYGFDFYHGMLFEFFLWHAEDILRAENKNRGEGNHVVANVKIYVAERGPINALSFQKSLQSSFNRLVAAHNQERHLPPDNFSFQTFVYTLPVTQSPFIQVSDLLSYVVRAHLNGFQQWSSESLLFLKNLKRTEISDRTLTTDHIVAFNGKNESNEIITLVVNREKSRKASSVVRLEEPFSRMLLGNLSHWIQESEDVRNRRLKELTEKLARLDRMRQMAESDQVLLAAETMVNQTREFTEAAFLIQLLQYYIENARVAEDSSLPSYLNRLEVQTAVLYLGVNNHLGHFPLNDACIRKAEPVAAVLRQDPAFWPLVCDFYNNMAVSLHNIFDFTEATQRLHALIEHLERELKNPFTGSAIKCYEIGALFGSYAQTLAFDAHCSFFRVQNNAAFLQMIDAAEYYSSLAMEHFDDVTDHERQITYQIHFNLQAYILTGEKSFLDKAAALLNSDGKTDEAIHAWITSCPERSMLNPAYRVSAALKYAFLSGKHFPETPDMIAAILKHRDILPNYHPMEQILAYLTMAAKNPEQRKRLREIMSHMKFPPNIVKTIQLIMQLQTAFYLKEPISLIRIQEIVDSLTPNIAPQWGQYGLIQVLQEYTRSPDRWHVGPMEVLPFNYC